jgi:hypothetical protein
MKGAGTLCNSVITSSLSVLKNDDIYINFLLKSTYLEAVSSSCVFKSRIKL